jgi:ComEC/Rec2-related protein
MRIPFLWLALGFSSGIIFYSAFHPALKILASLFLMGLPFLWMFRGQKIFIIFLVFLVFIAGMMATHRDEIRPSNAIENWTGLPLKEMRCEGNVSLEGIISNQPEIKIQGRKQTLSFILESKNLMCHKDKERQFFQVQGRVQVFLFQPSSRPDAGDRVRLWGKLEKPRPVINPGQFDYGSYLAQHRIYALFNGYGERSIRIIRTQDISFLWQALAKIQRAIAMRLEGLYQKDEAVLFKALILGTRKGLSSELRDDFIKTGTSHLLAISGLNIALVAGSLYFVFILLFFPQKWAAFFAFMVMLLQVAVAGFGIPVQRAGWMSGAGFLALIFERERQTLNAFFLAFFVILFFDTTSLINVSFQLSFLAVLSLILIIRHFDAHGRWTEFFSSSLAALVGTFPVVLYYFNVFSPVSILANLGAVPLFHMALLNVLVALFPIPLLGDVFAHIAHLFLQAALAWIHFCALPPWAFYLAPTPSFSLIGIYYLCLSAIIGLKTFYPQKKILIASLCSVWLFVFCLFFYSPTREGFKLTYFSAGKNELAAFHLNEKEHWLINTGRSFPSDQSEWILEPYFKKQGIKRLQGIILTDGQKKHLGGLNSLLRDFSTQAIFIPDTPHKNFAFFDPVRGYKKKIKKVRRKETIFLEQNAEIEILETSPALLFKIQYCERTFLYLPDLNERILEVLSVHQKELFDADVLILPSLNEESSMNLEKLFDRIDPLVIVAPGSSEQLKAAALERDLTLWDTQLNGAISFSIRGKRDNGLEVTSVLNGLLRKFKA